MEKKERLAQLAPELLAFAQEIYARWEHDAEAVSDIARIPSDVASRAFELTEKAALLGIDSNALKSAPEPEAEFNTRRIRDELREHGYIMSIWHIDDVFDRRPDLDQTQAVEVLGMIEKAHDANVGINWEVIDVTAQSLFPKPEDPNEDPHVVINQLPADEKENEEGGTRVSGAALNLMTAQWEALDAAERQAEDQAARQHMKELHVTGQEPAPPLERFFEEQQKLMVTEFPDRQAEIGMFFAVMKLEEMRQELNEPPARRFDLEKEVY